MELFAPYPETVFRFRSNSLLHLKELKYGEVYFASKDELNDPYDTKNPSLYTNDIDQYKRLINRILTNPIYARWNEIIDVNLIATFLAEETLIYDELILKIKSKNFEDIVLKAFAKEEIIESIGLAIGFVNSIKNYIYRAGGHSYIASFAKECHNPVMWSHYANHHKGFCLCFSIKDGTFKKRQPLSATKFPQECKFEEVKYDVKNVIINGFLSCFSRPDYGKNITQEEAKAMAQEYWEFKRVAYLTKFKSWEYEKEIRLLNDDWFETASDQDGIKKRLSFERIFHYDQMQLTGLIFGSKMDAKDMLEIREIISQNRSELMKTQYTPMDFLPYFKFYEAVENVNEFKMKIQFTDGLDFRNSFFPAEDLETKMAEVNQIRELYLKSKH